MNLLDKIDITTEAVAMEIKDLNGNPLTEIEAEKPKIYLYGIDSATFRNALKDGADTNEKDEYSGQKLIASCIQKWDNINDDNGLAIECNFNNALSFLKKYPVVNAQADKFIADRANFLKK